MPALETEVLIIGGGVLGAATARELSRYKTDVTVVEKNADVGWGITKANVGVVCQGRDTLEFRPEYHRTKLLWRALPLMEPLCEELGVPFKQVGGHLMIRDQVLKEKLDKLAKRTESLGLGSDRYYPYSELKEREPFISPRDQRGAVRPRHSGGAPRLPHPGDDGERHRQRGQADAGDGGGGYPGGPQRVHGAHRPGGDQERATSSTRRGSGWTG